MPTVQRATERLVIFASEARTMLFLSVTGVNGRLELPRVLSFWNVQTFDRFRCWTSSLAVMFASAHRFISHLDSFPRLFWEDLSSFLLVFFCFFRSHAAFLRPLPNWNGYRSASARLPAVKARRETVPDPDQSRSRTRTRAGPTRVRVRSEKPGSSGYSTPGLQRQMINQIQLYWSRVGEKKKKKNRARIFTHFI